MPPVLNAVATQNAYTDALTVIFPQPRTAFSINVFNAAIGYRLLYVGAGTPSVAAYQVESQEHHLAPSLSTFQDPGAEGLPPGAKFAGVQVRSWVAGVPAVVSVA